MPVLPLLKLVKPNVIRASFATQQINAADPWASLKLAHRSADLNVRCKRHFYMVNDNSMKFFATIIVFVLLTTSTVAQEEDTIIYEIKRFYVDCCG